MSKCGICWSEIKDGKPNNNDNLGYCGCEEENIKNYLNR